VELAGGADGRARRKREPAPPAQRRQATRRHAPARRAPDARGQRHEVAPEVLAPVLAEFFAWPSASFSAHQGNTRPEAR
jgi:hypothetical protein